MKIIEMNPFLKWIKEKEKGIYDPEDEGLNIDSRLDNGELDEREQIELQLLMEIKDYVELNKMEAK